jgi:hypothetical protein
VLLVFLRRHFWRCVVFGKSTLDFGGLSNASGPDLAAAMDSRYLIMGDMT